MWVRWHSHDVSLYFLKWCSTFFFLHTKNEHCINFCSDFGGGVVKRPWKWAHTACRRALSQADGDRLVWFRGRSRGRPVVINESGASMHVWVQTRVWRLWPHFHTLSYVPVSGEEQNRGRFIFALKLKCVLKHCSTYRYVSKLWKRLVQALHSTSVFHSG